MNMKVFVTKLCEKAIDLGSSDIHVIPEDENYGIYYRHINKIEKNYTLTEAEGRRLIAYFKYLGNMDVGERRRPQSGASPLTIYDMPFNARYSTMTTFQAQESLVIRLLSQVNQLNLEKQTFFKSEYHRIKSLVKYQSGLILFAGPVSSGKTTTMYHALTQQVDQYKKQVISIEDPVEIEEDRFLQFQVNETAGVTYDKLVKQSLRHHPDIMIIGEIRDEETANAAIRAALTGHLILASVHAKNAEGVVDRLLELGVAESLIAQTVIGVVFQKMLPKYCPFCKGICHMNCNHFKTVEKKAILYDVRGPEDIQALLNKQANPLHDFNHLLDKAYAYGFIHADVYQQYVIPNI